MERHKAVHAMEPHTPDGRGDRGVGLASGKVDPGSRAPPSSHTPPPTPPDPPICLWTPHQGLGTLATHTSKTPSQGSQRHNNVQDTDHCEQDTESQEEFLGIKEEKKYSQASVPLIWLRPCTLILGNKPIPGQRRAGQNWPGSFHLLPVQMLTVPPPCCYASKALGLLERLLQFEKCLPFKLKSPKGRSRTGEVQVQGAYFSSLPCPTFLGTTGCEGCQEDWILLSYQGHFHKVSAILCPPFVRSGCGHRV